MWPPLRNLAGAIRNDSTDAHGTPDGTEYIPLVSATGRPRFTKALASAFAMVTGAQTLAGVKTFSSMFRIPINADVAAAGTVLADAAQLSEGFTVVTGANGTLGVKLPAVPAPGSIVIIKGTTAGVLKVWPDAAATINAVGSNGAMSLASGVIPAIFVAKTATQWFSLPLVPS